MRSARVTAVDELIAFVRQQLDEDERVALAVTEMARFDEWDAVGSAVDDEIGRSNWEVVGIARPPTAPAAKAISQHIARWDPARVLAEVEAKRAMLDVILAYEAKIDGEWGCCHSADAIGAGRCPEIDPNEIHAIRVLAQPYAGREGWREEWQRA
jgi:hypothetical protein